MNCPLCSSPQPTPFSVEKKPPGRYFHCGDCDLIFMHPRDRLTFDDEKIRYDMHENENSAGYRKFLNPVIEEIESYASARRIEARDLRILDFGCGPTAYLSKMLAEKSYVTDNYDIFYYTNQTPLQRIHDVITSTEVWEHFYHPHEEIEQLTKLLKPGGLLVVMTSAHQDLGHFQDWYYRRDPTHVIFFSEKTMRWVAKNFKLELVKAQSPYWIFQKPVQ